MKERLDVIMFNQGLAPSREKAKIMIMEGLVFVENQKSDKPGTYYNSDSKIEVRGRKLKYVSRGGLKLEKAIDKFNINLENLNCMDVGASTGGFTDCMLKNGCSTVYSIDVGYGQLDWKLRNNPKVVNLERTNIRHLEKNLIKHPIDFFSVDISFISLTLALPVIGEIVKEEATGVCLIKPQFEAGKEKVGKKGVVREKSVHIETILKICDFCLNNGFSVLNLDFSPIKGPEGNREYLIFIKKSSDTFMSEAVKVEEVVENSHVYL